MNKQKALHALRSLEMTFEQKQELIEALTEGDGADGEGGSNTENIIINILDLWNNDEQEVSYEQIEAILNFKAILKRGYNYYSITSILNEGNGSWITIETGHPVKSDFFMVIEKDTSKLRLISNTPV